MFKEVVKKCRELDVYEVRSVSDKYLELVFYNKEIGKWQQMFADILGAAVKPPDKEPAKEDISLTKEHGGICDNQTLFKKEFDHSTVIAMFWPWRDGILTTLKAAVLKNEKKTEI